MVKPAVVYGSETWVITEIDMKRLGHGRGKYWDGYMDQQ